MTRPWVIITICVIVCLLLLGIYAMNPFNDVITTHYVLLGLIGCVLATILILKNPFYGLIFIIAVEHYSDFLALPGIGSISRLVGGIVAIGWIFKYVYSGKTYFFYSKATNLAALCLVFSIVISSLLSYLPVESLKFGLTLIILILLVFFIPDFLNDIKDLKILIMTIAISVGMASLIGIVQYQILGHGGVFGNVGMSGGELSRFAGFQQNANGYGKLLMSGIPVMLFFALNIKKLVFRLIFFLFLFTSIFSLFLTLSRTHIYGFIIFLIVFTFLNIMYKKINMKHIAYLLTILIIVTSVSYGMIFNIVENKLNSRITSFDDSSSKKRALLFKKGLNVLAEHPVFGVGFRRNFILQHRYDDEYHLIRHVPPHDIVSMLFAGTGLFGGLTFIFLCCITINFFYKSIMAFANRNQKYLFNFSIILLSAFISIILTGSGNYVVDQRIFWVYVAISTVLYRWSRSQSNVYKGRTDKNVILERLRPVHTH